MLESKDLSLLSAYNKKWNTKISPKDFACTRSEFFVALKTALNSGKRVEEYIKPKHQIKNTSLINSLNRQTDKTKHISAMQLMAENRTDNRATKNIEAIKKQTVAEFSEGDNVISEVSEIRTVQSNKRLKKTRRAIIVRESSERPPKTFVARTFNLLSFVAVSLVAVFLGIFVGNMVIAGKTIVSYAYDEADYIADYKKVYEANSTKDPSTVKAYDAYAMAEWQLKIESELLQNYTIEGFGYVRAKVSGIVQNQTIVKKVKKSPTGIINESITDGLIPAGERLEYNFESNVINSFVTKKVSGTPPTASYDAKPRTTYNLETDLKKFRAEYGIRPDTSLPYLVSEKTVDKSSECSKVDEGYKYTISLNKIFGVINYVPYMIHISGLTRPPTFYDLSLTFIVDDNYRFVSLEVSEHYQIYYMGLPADCSSGTTYKFAY